MKMDSTKSFFAVSDIIGKVLSVRGGNPEDMRLSKMRRHWQEITGETIALHSSPGMLRNAKLHVVVDSPVWAHHLRFMQRELSEKINAFFENEVVVRDLFFKQGRLEKGRCGANRFAVSTCKGQQRPTDSQIKEVDKATSLMKDEKLRESLRRIFTKQLTRRP